jgi:hypothetical protein
MAFKKQIKKEFEETRREVLSETLTLINSAFALVAALAWNEAIKALIDAYFPAGSGVYSKFTYALVVTLVLVFVTGRLSKLAARYNIEKRDTGKYTALVKNKRI